MKKIYLCVCLLFFCICSSGCSVRELEDVNFILTIGIDKAEGGLSITCEYPDFSGEAGADAPSGARIIASATAKNYDVAMQIIRQDTLTELDDQHVKAVVFGKELLKDTETMDDLIEQIQGAQTLNGNALCAVTENVAEFFEEYDNKAQALGMYLQELQEKDEQYKSENVCTLSDVKAEHLNQKELLLLPQFELSGGLPQVHCYCAIDAGKYVRDLTETQMQQVMLCQGQLRYLLLEDTWGNTIYFDEINTEQTITEAVELTQENSQKESTQKEHVEYGAIVTVRVDLKGELQTREFLDEHSVEQIENACEKKLKEQWQITTDDLLSHKIDTSNSYVYLDIKNRALFRRFYEKRMDYIRQMDIEYEVNCKIVEEDD